MHGFCKDCRHWQGDASNAVSSDRMRFCVGLTEAREPHPSVEDGSWIYKPDSALPEPVELPDYGSFQPRFITGPDFGCVKFSPSAPSENYDQHRRDVFADVTHWMPLPSAPSESPS